ncbi:CD3337/EF1877 family mobilome membrane protein [Priestia megaterium]|uniref:CD3337/EF1877 family mobilome membrane protein n=1 Tax=Priestia megaterium TaxID=1404 RepID=UPI002452F4B5|nr:type IV secretion system protein [Priestia megaterium]MDH3155953.1 type IV secretion system protein [Priestia megaterium]MED4116344.1 type IV secretion system protein [Priestia megaterium]
MKIKILLKIILFVFILATLCPVATHAEAPNVMDELMPKSDLPQTNAPLLRYNEVPLENYDIDIAVKGDEDSHWYDSINIFDVDEKLYNNIAAFQQQILSGIWYGYLVVVNFGIFLMEQAFTFDIIDSMLSYITVFISETGGTYGIGQFMGFMMIMVSGWLIYSFAQKKYRATVSGLIMAALLSAVFTAYVQNSDQLLGQLNQARNYISGAVLTSSTYSLGDGNEDAIRKEMVQDRQQDQATQSYKDTSSVRYGVSRIRNLMHDLLIVKPYLLLEFGTTNYGVIGGGKDDNASPSQIKAGKETVKKLLSKKPGDKERKNIVKQNANHSLFAPEHTNKRIVLSLLIWIPALVILAMVGYLATFIQIYGVGFLLTAITGVFVLFLSIFPAFQRFAKQFAMKLLGFLAMCIGLTVLLILLFSFVNISYKVASENNWAYAQTIIAVLIIVAAIFALQKQLFGYKLYDEKKQQIKQAWREKVDAIKYQDQQRQYARIEPFYLGNNVHSRSLSSQPGTTDARAKEHMEKAMERQSNKPTLRRNKPIDSNGNVIEDTPKRNVMPFKRRQEKEGKRNLSSENGVIPNPHKKAKENDPNYNQSVSDQMSKQQQRNQVNAPLKAQPKSSEQQEAMKNNQSASGNQNEQVMKKMRQQENQNQAPLKAQPQQESSSSQSSKVIEQMRRQEARSESQQAPIHTSRRLVPVNGDISTKQFNQEQAPLKAQPKPPQIEKTNQQFHKQMRQQQVQQEIQQGKEQASAANESNRSHIDRSKEIEQMRRQSRQD